MGSDLQARSRGGRRPQLRQDGAAGRRVPCVVTGGRCARRATSARRTCPPSPSQGVTHTRRPRRHGSGHTKRPPASGNATGGRCRTPGKSHGVRRVSVAVSKFDHGSGEGSSTAVRPVGACQRHAAPRTHPAEPRQLMPRAGDGSRSPVESGGPLAAAGRRLERTPTSTLR